MSCASCAANIENDLKKEEGIKSVESIGGYKELISKNGVFAIELKDVRVV